MDSTDDRLRTAIHEAGHAAVAWLLGQRAEWISIRPAATCCGFCEARADPRE